MHNYCLIKNLVYGKSYRIQKSYFQFYETYFLIFLRHCWVMYIFTFTTSTTINIKETNKEGNI